jgi:hypothetical protein
MGASSQVAGGLPTPISIAMVLAFAGFVFVRFGRGVRAKRVVWPLVLMTLGVAVLWLPAHDPRFGWRFTLLLAIPFVLGYWKYTFYPSCGAMISRGSMFRGPAFCSDCGRPLRKDI